MFILYPNVCFVKKNVSPILVLPQSEYKKRPQFFSKATVTSKYKSIPIRRKWIS